MRRGPGRENGGGSRRPEPLAALIPGVDLHSPLQGEPCSWRGVRAETDADRRLLRLCQEPPIGLFSWSVEIRLHLDDGSILEFRHVLHHARGSGGVRKAAIDHYSRLALDVERKLQERFEARHTAERLAGARLPALAGIDSQEERFDAWLRGLTRRSRPAEDDAEGGEPWPGNPYDESGPPHTPAWDVPGVRLSHPLVSRSRVRIGIQFPGLGSTRGS